MRDLSSLDVETIQQARTGDRQSRDALAQRVRERVYPYIRRVVLDEHATEDLTQESVTRLLASLDSLRQPDRFWFWVLAIASRTIARHFRQLSVRKDVPMSSVDETLLSRRGEDGLAGLAKKELAELTYAAMGDVSDQQRMVLVLHVFEDMPYADIARLLDTSALNVRATFFRGRRSLVRALRRRGVDKAVLPAALVAFGHLTAPPGASAATVAVSASALGESVLGGLFAGKAVAALLAVLLVAAGLWQFSGGGARGGVPGEQVNAANRHQPQAPPPAGPAAVFVHFQTRGPCPTVTTPGQDPYDHWYYFPDGPGGPFLYRRDRWNADRTRRLQWWLRDGWTCYQADLDQGVIRIQNQGAGCCNLHMLALPTDPEDFARQAWAMEGDSTHAMVDKQGFSFQRDPVTGFVTWHLDLRFGKDKPFESVYDYSQLDPTVFAFKSDPGMRVIDERDEVHRRGWTYFRVEGRIEGSVVSGAGCLPFAYGVSLTHPAWLTLQVDGKTRLIDTAELACVVDAAGGVRKVLPGGSFFKGLARPWTGVAVMDTLRRDAAEEQLLLQIEGVEGARRMEFTLEAQRGGVCYHLLSTVDPATELVERIGMGAGQDWVFDKALGELRFTYLSDVDDPGNEFEPPAAPVVPAAAAVGRPTVFWPLDLGDIEDSPGLLELATDHPGGPSGPG